MFVVRLVRNPSINMMLKSPYPTPLVTSANNYSEILYIQQHFFFILPSAIPSRWNHCHLFYFLNNSFHKYMLKFFLTNDSWFTFPPSLRVDYEYYSTSYQLNTTFQISISGSLITPNRHLFCNVYCWAVLHSLLSLHQDDLPLSHLSFLPLQVQTLYLGIVCPFIESECCVLGGGGFIHRPPLSRMDSKAIRLSFLPLTECIHHLKVCCNIASLSEIYYRYFHGYCSSGRCVSLPFGSSGKQNCAVLLLFCSYH